MSFPLRFGGQPCVGWPGPRGKCRTARLPAPRSKQSCTVVCQSATARITSPLEREQRAQALALDRVIDALDVDSLAELAFHSPDDIRGLVASESVRSAALVTVPLSSTLAVVTDADDGRLSILAPPELPSDVKQSIEAAGALLRDIPDPQTLVLAALLLWVRKYGSTAWKQYCEALLPPSRELSCLLCYSPGELYVLQLSDLKEEASRQHDWARWAHTKWLSSASGALQQLGLATDPSDTTWALAVVRSRAVEFPLGGLGADGRSPNERRPEGPLTGRTVSVLAPVIDMANHSSDPNCVVQLTTDRSRVVLLPRRPVAAGEPLTVDYGFDRTSLELMADYGFVATANCHDGATSIIPEADKLPPLDPLRLQAAARSLQRQWRSVLERQRRAMAAAAGGGAGERSEMQEEDEGDEDEGLEDMLIVPEEEGEEEEHYRNRLRAAIDMLTPRTNVAYPDYSTPATRRIVAGLWHKLVQHTADGLPTSLDQDRQMLYDIQTGRVSGFASGLPLSVDPTSPSDARRREKQAWSVQAEVEARGIDGGPNGTAVGSASTNTAMGEGVITGEFRDVDVGTQSATGGSEDVGRDGAGQLKEGAVGDGAAAEAAAGAASGMLCRTGRRAGRLYAAVRARLERKELLAVAEELLLQYARG